MRALNYVRNEGRCLCDTKSGVYVLLPQDKRPTECKGFFHDNTYLNFPSFVQGGNKVALELMG